MLTAPFPLPMMPAGVSGPPPPMPPPVFANMPPPPPPDWSSYSNNAYHPDVHHQTYNSLHNEYAGYPNEEAFDEYAQDVSCSPLYSFLQVCKSMRIIRAIC